MPPNPGKSLPLSIVILAAGQGKRMQSDLPKVLQPLAGRPLLWHVLAAAAQLDPVDCHVVYGHGGEQVREAVNEHSPNLNWVLQAQQLGTGHAVQQALPEVPDNHLVLVLYGDVPLIGVETLRALIALAGAKSIGLLTVKLADPAGYGRIVRDSKDRVLRIVEQKDASRRELKLDEGNTGVLAAPAKLLKRWLARLKNNNAQGEYYLTDIIAMAVKDKIKVAPLVASTEAEVLGVNDKLQLAQLESEYRRQRATALMRAGVTVIDPARLDVRGVVSVGRDVTLDVNVVLEGPVSIGDGVSIGPNSVLSDVRVASGTRIKANCVIESAEIGKGCVIGPFARVRPETTLHDGVHLGNFVEVKNSVVGSGSKANHLTYIGDADVGDRTNIGAGTVVCNYDGANKWRSTIGSNVFVGSGSMLVAPIKVGDGATIGAGSTVSNEVPAGELTLERSQQRSIPGWQRPVKQKS